MKERDEVLASIDAFADRAKVSRSKAFAAWFAVTFFDLDEDDALELAEADGGNDQGIDIAFANQKQEQIVVLQAHCPTNLEKVTPKAKWDALVDAVPYVLDPANLARSGRIDLATSIQQLRDENPDYSIVMGLITMGRDSNQIKRSVDAHAKSKDKQGVEFFYLSQERILENYATIIAAEQGIPEDTFTFDGGYYQDKGEYGAAWVGSVNAGELRRLHGDHGDQLFAGNVRLFLGSRKGGINDEMIKTAQKSPGKFWALNNGITIVADSVESKGARAKSTFLLRRFSIVNGCQTTSCLVQSGVSDSPRVLVRVIQASKGIRNDIVQYNNSQNAVKIWTVRAVDAVQQRLRKEFMKVGIDYAPKLEGGKRRNREKRIELDKVAQYLAASKQEYLIQAINNKGDLFDQPYKEIFRRDLQAKDVYLAWLVGNMAEDARRALLDSIEGDANAPLLGVKSTYWILYCTYKLLDAFCDVDSPQITPAKMGSKEFQGALRNIIQSAADLYFDSAVDTYDSDEFLSHAAVFRSTKFLERLNSKVSRKVAKLQPKKIPSLVAAAKSASA